MDYPGKVITKNQVTPTQTSASGVWTVDDAAAAVENNSWPVAGVPNPISRSLRFNSADSAYLNRTPGSAPTAATKGTWSFWIKGRKLATEEYVFGSRDGGNSASTFLRFESGDTLRFYNHDGSNVTWNIITTQVFRDPGSWMHIIIALDTTQATDTNRVKFYVNGVQVTAFGTASYPAQNATMTRWAANGIPNYIGNEGTTPGNYGDYYLAETYFIDGSALTPTSFGMTDPVTGAWIPKAYNGTYGTNGFYLNFSNNSSTAALGTDYSGNSNTWTTNNFSVTAGAGNDSLTDVPTPWIAYNTTGDVGGVVRGNYATLNPLAMYGTNAVLTNGSLTSSATSTSNNRGWPSTIAAPGSDKWYAEFTFTTTDGDNNGGCGIMLENGTGAPGEVSGTVSWRDAGTLRQNASNTNYGSALTTNDVVMVAYDAALGRVWFGKNGSWFASGDPATNANPSATGITTTGRFATYHFAAGAVIQANFGQRPFAYTPPAGFLSLCTTNLPTPTILDGGEYFNAVLYTGNGSTQNITGVGFQPDFTWIKSRSNATYNNLFDVIRGPTKVLFSNDTLAEVTNRLDNLTSFDSDGFSVGADTDVNGSARTMVAWNWKANGAGVSNTDGTITSSVSVNTTSGFSIVTYTGVATDNTNFTVGHGLGVKPAMVIIKNRDWASSSKAWPVWHQSISTGGVFLDSTDITEANNFNYFWGAQPNSTTFTIRSDTAVTAANRYRTNGQTDGYVAYCFAAVPGFSAFGSYTGNGSADGPFVYTGFRVAYVMIKGSSFSSNWRIADSARNTYNVASANLEANLTDAEGATANTVDFLSNGFKIRGTGDDLNTSSGTIIYMAFAENPFKYSNAR